ncbi:MAG: M28 family peptidase [Bacteroidetes bacterium]|nr:M28 family peptidase [Bacteroidota bacterium]
MKRFFVWTISAVIASSSFAQNLSWKEKRISKRIQSSVSYLASDALEGRSTGSQGELASALYIAGKMKKLGLAPMGVDGYMQPFAITTLRIADGSSRFTINDRVLTVFTDYFPLSYSTNEANFSGSVIDVGFGISEEGYNDYKDKDVRNKLVAINVSSPDGIHPHSKYIAWHGITKRVDEAVKQGASGVVFYRLNDGVEPPESDLSLKMEPSSVPVIYYTALVPDANYFRDARVDLSLRVLTDVEYGHNVLGFVDNGAKTTVVIGAHHDHLGHNEHGGSRDPDGHEVHNGADDNASGVAVMLELARKLRKSKGWNRNNNYLFMAFSGEEMGLIGSKYFCEHPTIDLGSVNYMLNMDMVGMLDSTERTLIINGVGTSSKWEESIIQLKPEMRGISHINTTKGGIGPSDHTSFYLKEIPSIHFFTGSHEHYHKPTDDAFRLNYGGSAFITCFIVDMVKDLNVAGKLDYIQTVEEDSASAKSKRTKFAVTLGVVPSYDYAGEGFKLDAVQQGKPADVAGVKGGDIIISFNNEKVKDIYDYMNILGQIKVGDLVPIQVQRGGEIISLTIQF